MNHYYISGSVWTRESRRHWAEQRRIESLLPVRWEKVSRRGTDEGLLDDTYEKSPSSGRDGHLLPLYTTGAAPPREREKGLLCSVFFLSPSWHSQFGFIGRGPLARITSS